jgi:hypothetical protein
MCRRIQVTVADIYYKICLMSVNIYKFIFYESRRPIVARLGAGQRRNCDTVAESGRHSVQCVSFVIFSNTMRSERDADHFTSV